MATQAQKDKAVTAAEKRLLVVAKRVEKLEKRITDTTSLDVQLAEAKKALVTAQSEVDWAKSRPVFNGDDAVDEDDVDEDELGDDEDDEDDEDPDVEE